MNEQTKQAYLAGYTRHWMHMFIMPLWIWRYKAGGCILLLALAALPTIASAGPWHAAEPNTGGWSYMKPDERIEHQRRMRSFKTYEECKDYQAKHQALMAKRASKQGIVLQPKSDAGCEQLRQRGQFK